MSPSLLRFLGSDDDRPSYPRRVVDVLLELKADGWNFERSWSIATAQHPPPLTWQHSGSGTESPFHFLRRHCEAAWHNRPTGKACVDCRDLPCTCEVVEFGAAA